MENPMTPPAKTPEEIEREMLSTRESLTEKVAALETQVVGTVQTAANTLTETVETVKSFVTEAPGAMTDSVKQAAAAVSETVKETFDISAHVRNHPWVAVGTAAGLGFCVGCLLGGRSRSDAASVTIAPSYAAQTPPPLPTRPGVLDGLFAVIGQKVKELAETALESTTASLKTSLQDTIPKYVNEAATHLVETQRIPTNANRPHNGAQHAWAS